MSSSYRKILGPAHARLKKYLAEQADHDAIVDPDKSKQENFDSLTDLIALINFDSSKIDKAIKLILETNDAWVQYMQSIDDADLRASEEQKFEDFSPEGNDYLATVDVAREALDTLDAKLQEAQRLRDDIRLPNQPPRLNTPPRPNTPSQPNPAQPALAGPPQPTPFIPPQYSQWFAGSPKKKFNGNVLKYNEFEQTFSVSVDQQPIPDVIKFRILIDWVQGEAYRAIAGFAVTETNYPLAKDVLKRRFGNPTLIKNALHSSIRNLQPASNDTKILRTTLERIDMSCRQLEISGDDVENYQLGMAIESKFPSLLDSIYKWKASNPTWAVTNLRGFINDLILRRETVDRLSFNYTSTPKSHRDNRQLQNQSRNSTQPTQRSNTFSATTLQSNSNRPNSSPSSAPKTPCSFCGGNHWNRECLNHPDTQSKRNALTNKKACWICYRTDHRSHECSKPPCSICNGLHNSLICNRNADNINAGNQSNPQTRNSSTTSQRPQQPSRNQNTQAPRQTPNNSNSRNSRHSAQRRTTNVALAERQTEEPPLNFFTAFCTNSSSNDVHTNSGFQSSPSQDLAIDSKTLLMTVKALARNPANSDLALETHVFFDSGSEDSYIITNFSDSLQLQPVGTVDIALYTFASQRPVMVKSSLVELELVSNEGSNAVIKAATMDHMTPNLKNVSVTEDSFLIEGVNLDTPDTKFVKVGILIGLDYFWYFIRDKRLLPCGKFLVDTIFGPVLCGKNLERLYDYQANPYDTMRFTSFAHPNLPISEDSEVDDSRIETFWNLESIGITDSPDSIEDDLAMKKFLASIHQKDGRYVVRLPWKEDHPHLPSNFGLCFGRLKNNWKKLCESSDPTLLDKYNDIFLEELENGMIEKVTAKDSPYLIHYLSHHPVKHPQKSGKLRKVVDGSAKLKNEPCINDCLLRGPVFLNDLVGLWLRFRTYKNIMIADIVKAFLNVEIAEEDQDACRFLWLKDHHSPPSEKNLQVYKYRRVCFGLKPSPFLLAGTLKVHLTKIGTPTAKQILRNLYVDNMLQKIKDPLDAIVKYNETIEIFAGAGMRCQEFASNIPEVNEFFESMGTPVPETQRVLGIDWSIRDDTINFKLPTLTSPSLTKRQVLKIIAKIFDPTGLLSPVTVNGKMFFQSLWKTTHGWDDQLTPDEATLWQQCTIAWESTLFCFSRLAIPLDEDTPVELHAFVDASSQAYVASIYIHDVRTNTSALIFSKNRLAPVKKNLTIPKLELMAAVIGVRLAAFVTRELECQIVSKYLWSDNQAVLQWIYSSKDQKRFIKNRLLEIRQAAGFEFRYVPTEQNPADLATRGLTIEEFSDQSRKDLWFKGPSFLRQGKDQYPKNIEIPATKEDLYLDSFDNSPSLRIVNSVFKLKTNSDSVSLFDAKRVDSYLKLINIVVFVLRFITKTMPTERLAKSTDAFLKKFNRSRNGKYTTTQDRELAEILLIRQVQQESPPDLEHQQQLDLYYDRDDLIRCNGRLEYAGLHEDAIHPIFLHSSHPVTRLVVLFYHSKMHHAGIATTLAAIRDRFWIPSGRRLVKNILYNCMYCRRYTARPFKLPKFPDLPAERVTRSPAFFYCGLDYIGPMTVKINGQAHKLWISLFVCLSTRAIHLEYVLDLSAFAFVNALRRFVSRRGAPRKMYSDNATQFGLAEKAIKASWDTIYQDKLTINYFAKQSIDWKYITPTASWQGGHYERLVALVKNAIKRCIGRNQLTFESFITLLAEIEALVNSRPLTYLYDDFNSIQVLRPSDFLHPDMSPGISPIVEDLDNDEYIPKPTSRDTLLNMWKKSTECLDKFWNMWSQEYLKSLRERYKMTHQTPRSTRDHTPKVNEIVLLGDDELPRGFWKLARIVEVYLSADGQVRSAKIELPNKTHLKRPISSLYPLEVTEESTPSTDLTPTQVNFTSASRRTTFVPKLIGYLTLLTFLTLVSPSDTSAHTCAVNEHLNRIHSQSCVSKGIAVMQDSKGYLCWTKISCPTGHIHPLSQYCGPKCKCFEWAMHCSHYNGSHTRYSNKSNTSIIEALEEEFPEVICSLTPSNSCDSTPLFGRFNQVSLFDNSTYLVSSLQLQQREVVEDDVTCVGDLTSNDIVGTPKYCENHRCDSEGKKFCYYAESELVTLQTDHSEIPIKAWGTISITYYGFLSKTPTTCSSCSFKCEKGGSSIRLDKSIQRIESCATSSTSICYIINTPESSLEVNFPAEIIMEPYNLTLSAWSDGVRVYSSTLACPPQPFCEQITCTMCWVRAANPQCIPRETLLVLLILLYLGTVSIYYLCKALYCLYPFIREPLLVLLGLCRILWNQSSRILRYFRHQIRPNQESRPLLNNANRFRFIPARLRRQAAIMAMITIMYILAPATQACSEITPLTASHEVCHTGLEGLLTCTFSQTTLLSLLPKGQEVCLILQDEAKHPIGTLSLRVLHIAAVCKKESTYYTRSFGIKVESSKRCPHAGSCSTDVCNSIQPKEKIPELNGTANESPGHTFCFEIGDGFQFPLTCDFCFDCHTPACLFFRHYAFPMSSSIFEIFRCPLWEVEAQTLLSLHIGHKSEEHTLILRPGQTTSHNHIKLTLVSNSLPPAPSLGSYFLTDGTRYTLVHGVSPRGHPTPGLIGSLQCTSKEAAQAFDCYYPPSLCSCQSGYTKPSCSCADMTLETFFTDPQTTLPVQHEGLLLRHHESRIEALFEVYSSIQLQITMMGLRATIKIDSNTCEITNAKISGCYQCLTGAKIQMTCRTNFGEALAKVQCANNTNFVVPCDASRRTSTITVNFEKSILDEECTVFCPGGSSNLRLQGTLAYVETPRYANYSNIKVVNNSPHIFELPNIDIGSLFTFLTSRYLYIGLVLGIVLMAIMTIRFLPILLNFMFEIFQKFSIFLPPPFRFVTFLARNVHHERIE